MLVVSNSRMKRLRTNQKYRFPLSHCFLVLFFFFILLVSSLLALMHDVMLISG